jgi:hypothetical protein
MDFFQSPTNLKNGLHKKFITLKIFGENFMQQKFILSTVENFPRSFSAFPRTHLWRGKKYL